MKKVVGSILGFTLSVMMILVSCTTYQEDKVYSERDTRKEIDKVAYITRNEAVKIGKDLLKKAGNIDVDNMDLKEEITLNKDEKQNKFEWDIKWRTKDDIGNQVITIDASTGEINKFGVSKGGKLDTKEIFKLSKGEIDKIIGDALKVIGKDIKNYKISYSNGESKYIINTGSKLKREDRFSHRGSLKDGYAKFATMHGENESERIFLMIDAKDKRLKSFYIEPKNNAEDK